MTTFGRFALALLGSTASAFAMGDIPLDLTGSGTGSGTPTTDGGDPPPGVDVTLPVTCWEYHQMPEPGGQGNGSQCRSKRWNGDHMIASVRAHAGTPYCRLKARSRVMDVSCFESARGGYHGVWNFTCTGEKRVSGLAIVRFSGGKSSLKAAGHQGLLPVGKYTNKAMSLVDISLFEKEVKIKAFDHRDSLTSWRVYWITIDGYPIPVPVPLGSAGFWGENDLPPKQAVKAKQDEVTSIEVMLKSTASSDGFLSGYAFGPEGTINAYLEFDDPVVIIQEEE